LQIEPIGEVTRMQNEECVITVSVEYREGLHGIAPGDRLDVYYWMHKLEPDQRRALKVHPQGDTRRPVKGVFGLRSPMRPNPIGVSTVHVKRVEEEELVVTAFDAEEGSPVVDVKASATDAELKRLIRTWGEIHDTIVRSLETAIGEARLRAILYRPVREIGGKEAEGRKADASTIGRQIMRFEESWGIEGRVIEDTSDRFVREVTHCPWSYFRPLSCKIFAWWMQGFCKGSNPRSEYCLQRMIPDGEVSCLWSVVMKGE
jgi:tRNA-Thr(GGU) m(6)t(6)A37 methyltransferase TsaA